MWVYNSSSENEDRSTLRWRYYKPECFKKTRKKKISSPVRTTIKRDDFRRLFPYWSGLVENIVRMKEFYDQILNNPYDPSNLLTTAYAACGGRKQCWLLSALLHKCRHFNYANKRIHDNFTAESFQLKFQGCLPRIRKALEILQIRYKLKCRGLYCCIN